MKKKMLSIALALCLALSLAIPVCAAEITEEPMITPSSPIHPYSNPPIDTNDPNWSSGYPSTHQFITENAIKLVRNVVSSYPLTSYTSTLKTQSDWPDSSIESYSMGENDNGLFLGHFYDPDTRTTYDGSSSPTAKVRLVNHYQAAVSRYKAGNKSSAMTSLAFALHYAADLSTPHHAANKTAANSNHVAYENWVKNNQNSYIETSLSSDALSWAKRTSISDMGHNFAVNAKAQINNALSSNTYATATRNALPKAQRNCAVVIYKFLVDVGAVK